MKKYLWAISFFMIFSVFSPGKVFAVSEVSTDEILKKVDEIRCPTQDYSTIAVVTSYRPERLKRTAVYEVRAKGPQKTVVETIDPASERGQMILMSDADYWAFLPEVSQPLRIAAQERLVGDIFHGDIARTNFFGDYDAKIIREESSVENKYYVLELTAKNDKATYSKINLWVDQKKFWPLKSELFAKSGRLLKTCFFENYKMFAGIMRPSRLMLKDAIVEGQYSIIEYNKFDVHDIPSKQFTKEYLRKMVF